MGAERAKVENFELYKIGQKHFEIFELSISIDRKTSKSRGHLERRRGLNFYGRKFYLVSFDGLKLGAEALPGTFFATGLLNPTTSVSATRSLSCHILPRFEIGVSVRGTKL